MQTNENTIRDYIQITILNNSPDHIEEDQDLLLSGLLDSLSVIKLVAWLESIHDIKIPPEDVLIEHFGTLSDIVSYLATRKP